MKKLACEMCGSTNIIKKEGLYNCQNCGTKYSPEEAKKMMIEGTVKLDIASNVENYKKIAKNAFLNNRYEFAYDYYNKIIELDADDLKSVYMTELMYYSCSLLKVDNLPEPLIKILFKDNNFNDLFIIDDEIQEKFAKLLFNEIIKNIHEKSLIIPRQKIFYNNTHHIIEESFINTNNEYIYTNNFYKILIAFNFDDKKITEYKEKILENYKENVEEQKRKFEKEKRIRIERERKNIEEEQRIRIERERKNIKELQIKRIENRKNEKIGRDGYCYIATSVYGSYDCPEVWSLRRFRDNNLLKTFYGRLFVKIYYISSPTLVNYFGDKKLFKKLFKSRLDKLIKKLHENGVESTYYIDK